MRITPYLEAIRNRRIAAILLLGFSSGLPLALTGGTLQAWMADVNVDLKTIGIFSLVGLPYTFKFLWAPVMDRFVPPFMGRRRGWLVLTQLFIAAVIFAMGGVDPVQAPYALAALAVMLAFASASQDIVFDAYRADVLREKERGIGAGLSVLAYRIAMLAAGAGALILADQVGWERTYWVLGGLMLVGLAGSLLGPEPEVAVTPPKNLLESVAGPFKEFFSRRGALALLALIILYKLGDAFAGSLSTAFLISGPGFTKTEVGAVAKGAGLIATLFGAVFGGALMIKLGLWRSLLAFGVLQAITNLGFMVLATAGHHLGLLAVVVVLENLAGGMGTAAFVALLMALCNVRYTATQFALLSALASIGRIFVGPASGVLAESLGWPMFFFLTFLAALPGLWLLYAMKKEVVALDHRPAA